MTAQYDDYSVMQPMLMERFVPDDRPNGELYRLVYVYQIGQKDCMELLIDMVAVMDGNKSICVYDMDALSAYDCYGNTGIRVPYIVTEALRRMIEERFKRDTEEFY